MKDDSGCSGGMEAPWQRRKALCGLEGVEDMEVWRCTTM